MAFWIVCSMKAIKEQIDEQPKIIKLFSVNYARDLICIQMMSHLIILNKFACIDGQSYGQLFCHFQFKSYDLMVNHFI